MSTTTPIEPENTVTARSLANPDASRTFLDNSVRSVVALSTMVVGLGEYRPGWRWSDHALPLTGKPSEHHMGYVVAGRMMVEGSDGMQVEIGPNEAFEAYPGHDAWVVGNEPCIALDFAAIEPPA